jgi:hypothetical protein
MADAITVGLEGWLEQLTEAVTNFRSLLQLRNESVAPTLPQENLKTVRREIDVIYHKMIARINAAAELDDTGKYDAFIRQLNAEIHYFNEHTHIHARKDLGEGDRTVIEPIDVQRFTGEAITPIPVAYYHGEGKPAVKLTFAEDFTLTYKNNVKPGMAEVSIHGKGAYRGRKVTTFSIVNP